MNNFIKIALLTLVYFSVVNVYAEQEPTHKHSKATMAGESHGSSELATATDQNSEEMPKHKHYKVTMPGESHQDFVEDKYPKNTAKKSEPTHKHYKGTMKGESHNE
ncbi:MAG: hypothetical protein KUG81_02365 [Gammaproteobacteria bacterium]|nr:hypothetical protein [Gammaproteobacteria bacterium]